MDPGAKVITLIVLFPAFIPLRSNAGTQYKMSLLKDPNYLNGGVRRTKENIKKGTL